MSSAELDIFQWIRTSERKLINNESILTHIKRKDFIEEGKRTLVGQLGDVFGAQRPTFDYLLRVINTWMTTQTDFEEKVTEVCGPDYVSSVEYQSFSLWCSFLILMDINQIGYSETPEET